MLATARKRQMCSVGLNSGGALGLDENENRSKLTMACVFYSCTPSSFVTNVCVYQKKKIETFRSHKMIHVDAGLCHSV